MFGFPTSTPLTFDRQLIPHLETFSKSWTLFCAITACKSRLVFCSSSRLSLCSLPTVNVTPNTFGSAGLCVNLSRPVRHSDCGKCLEVMFLKKSFSIKKGGRDGEGEGNRLDHILSIWFYDFRQSVGWVYKWGEGLTTRIYLKKKAEKNCKRINRIPADSRYSGWTKKRAFSWLGQILWRAADVLGVKGVSGYMISMTYMVGDPTPPSPPGPWIYDWEGLMPHPIRKATVNCFSMRPSTFPTFLQPQCYWAELSCFQMLCINTQTHKHEHKYPWTHKHTHTRNFELTSNIPMILHRAPYKSLQMTLNRREHKFQKNILGAF